MENKIVDGRYKIISLIDEGGISKVYLAEDMEIKREVAFRTLKNGSVSDRVEDVIRFRNEARILSRLDHPNLVKVYETGESEGENYIVMEYVRGESLYKILKSGKKFTEKEAIDIIIQACRVLEYIHSNGIVHRDLKPGNIMRSLGNGGYMVKIIDFGLALLKEFTAVKEPERIAGTFGYMPPESFGVIRYGVDERSDLYSLGVILYQLLTGVMPFEGKSSGEIIHMQIAKKPASPTKYNKDISGTLEEIVNKLLEKEPDKRYQSAKGLLRDLERYSKGERNFPAGMNDRQITLSFRTGLISRNEELKKMKRLYLKALMGEGNIFFIEGEAGKGKTRLVEELGNHIYKRGRVFIDGKCFSGKSKMPYGPFSDALNVYLKRYQDYQDERKKEIRQRLSDMTGDLSGIILQLNPALSIIFEKNPVIVKLEPDREKKRFLTVMSQFFLNLSDLENGLTLLLDDLQWVDDGSMELIGEISKKLGGHPFFIIGTYRSDEIDEKHSVSLYMREAEKNKYQFRNISLSTFNLEGVIDFVKNLLYTREEEVKGISRVVYQKSKGNPFFAIEIVKQLVDEKVIEYEDNGWKINNEALENMEIAPTILDIVMRRILLLNEKEVKVLSYAAMIGRKFEVEILFRLLPYEPSEVIGIVDRAIKLQLLEENSKEKNEILFAHDRIKEVFYRKIGSEERKALHRQIGRAMEELKGGNVNKAIFDLAYQYIEGEEDDKIVEYAFLAGMEARKNHASEETLSYLNHVIEILDKKGEMYGDKWQQCQEGVCEIYMMMGKNVDAINIYKSLIPLRKEKLEKARIDLQISQSYFKNGDFFNCEKYVMQGLAELKEHIPDKRLFVILSIIKELAVHVFHNLFQFFYSRKKPGPDKEKYKLIIWFYYTLGWSYILTDIVKFSRTVLRTMNISESKLNKTKELGLCVAAYGSLLMAISLFKGSIRNHEKALKFRKEINDIWGIGQSLEFMGYCYQFAGDYRKSIHYLNEGIEMLKRTGDFMEIEIAEHNLSLNYNFLADYKKQAAIDNKVREISSKTNYLLIVSEADLRSGIMFLETGHYDMANEKLTKAYKYHKTGNFGAVLFLASIYLGELYLEERKLKESLDYMLEARALHESNNIITMVFKQFYSIFAEWHIQNYLDKKENLNKREKREYLGKIKVSLKTALKQTRAWPTHYPAALRIAGIYYALAGRNKKSEEHFVKSIELSRRIGRRYEQGKSYYEYGKFLMNLGRKEEAGKNFESAYSLFKEIGSKVYLEKAMDKLGIKEGEKDENFYSIEKLKTREKLASIIKVSQKISSILEINSLLESIVSLAMETIGAQRGYLFIKGESGNLELKVKKNINKDNGKYNLPEPGEQYSRSIVNSVFKTGKVALVANAGKDELYAKFESVILYKLKSILCIPMKHRNMTIGVCYFDNPLSAAVFSRDNIEILEVIMVQAAISIENAALYEKTKKIKDHVEEEVEKLSIHISRKQEKLLDEKTAMVYQSGKMHEVVEKVKQAVIISKPILIMGETGTGKELIAKLIHDLGKDNKEPFIIVNCATVPQNLWESELFGHVKGAYTDAKKNRTGRVEEAGKGTLFFDEIGEIPLEVQSKMLRLLQEKEYGLIGSNKVYTSNCRFVFATNRNIEKMIKEGAFREDLFYRINVFTINIPPLRERKEDIPILVEHLIGKFLAEFNLPGGIRLEKIALESIMNYNWPGNIREMENIIIRALAVLASSEGDKSILKKSHLPLDIEMGPEIKRMQNDHEIKLEEELEINGNYDEIIDEQSRKLILWALSRAKGNKTKAAEILGIKRNSLNYKMKELNIGFNI